MDENPKTELPETNKDDAGAGEFDKHEVETLREEAAQDKGKIQMLQSKQEGEIASLNERAVQDQNKIKELQDGVSKDESKKVLRGEDILEGFIELIPTKDREIC